MAEIYEYTGLIEFFRNLQVAHPQIESFYRMDIKELLKSSFSRNGAGATIMVLERTEGSLVGSNNDNVQEGTTFAFSILQISKLEDYDHNDLVYSDCKKIGFEIIGQILKIREEGLENGNPIITDFKLPGIKFYAVGPLLGERFGMRFEAKMGNKAADINN